MPLPQPIVEKVVAYITKRDRLLVFRHTQYPEAGIQAPAGTVEPGESAADAVLREAREETGLANLAIRAYLGSQDEDMSALGRSEIHRRHFFHLALEGAAPERWRHFESYPSDGTSEPIEFEFFWVRFPEEVPQLSGILGSMLGSLPCSPGPAARH